MRISELITRLQEIRAEKPDQDPEILVYTVYDTAEIKRIATWDDGGTLIILHHGEE